MPYWKDLLPQLMWLCDKAVLWLKYMSVVWTHLLRSTQWREKILRVHFMYQGLFGDMVQAIFLQHNFDSPPIWLVSDWAGVPTLATITQCKWWIKKICSTISELCIRITFNQTYLIGRPPILAEMCWWKPAWNRMHRTSDPLVNHNQGIYLPQKPQLPILCSSHVSMFLHNLRNINVGGP